MSPQPHVHDVEHADRLAQYVLGLLPSDEAARLDRLAADCAECRREVESLRATVDSFPLWPAELLQPSPRLWDRVTGTVGLQNPRPGAPADAADTAGAAAAARPLRDAAPEWIEAGPGLDYVVLSEDVVGQRVSLLVRLAPGCAYPPHRHAGIEELWLLDGELWIGDRLLRPGDYNRAEAGTSDRVVRTDTGCACILIASTLDAFG